MKSRLTRFLCMALCAVLCLAMAVPSGAAEERLDIMPVAAQRKAPIILPPSGLDPRAASLRNATVPLNATIAVVSIGDQMGDAPVFSVEALSAQLQNVRNGMRFQPFTPADADESLALYAAVVAEVRTQLQALSNGEYDDVNAQSAQDILDEVDTHTHEEKMSGALQLFAMVNGVVDDCARLLNAMAAYAEQSGDADLIAFISAGQEWRKALDEAASKYIAGAHGMLFDSGWRAQESALAYVASGYEFELLQNAFDVWYGACYDLVCLRLIQDIRVGLQAVLGDAVTDADAQIMLEVMMIYQMDYADQPWYAFDFGDMLPAYLAAIAATPVDGQIDIGDVAETFAWIYNASKDASDVAQTADAVWNIGKDIPTGDFTDNVFALKLSNGLILMIPYGDAGLFGMNAWKMYAHETLNDDFLSTVEWVYGDVWMRLRAV